MPERRIVKAWAVQIDERTDVREYCGDAPAGELVLDYLNGSLEAGTLELAPGLRGWPPYTHTCHSRMGTYHIQLIPAKPAGETVPCHICGADTLMTATKLCDGCWEVDRRLEGFLSHKAGARRVIEILRDQGYVIILPRAAGGGTE